MDMLGKEFTRNIWLGASEEPVRWKPTAWPLEKEQIEAHLLRTPASDRRGDGFE
jgi:hypothetical protein